MKRIGIVLVAAVIVLLAAVTVFAGCEKTKTGKANDDVVDSGKDTAADAGSEDDKTSGENGVAVFFVKGETTVATTREVEGGALRALKELLGGPNESEKARGLETVIPAGVQINSFEVVEGTAKVDFSSELLNYGGGSARVEAIIRQIEKTLLENDSSIETVMISVNGVPSSQCLQP